MFKRFFTFLAHTNTPLFIFLMLVLMTVIKIPGDLIGSAILTLFHLNNPLFSADQQLPSVQTDEIITAIVVAPLLETFIGQVLPVTLARKYLKNTKASIIIAACVFSLLHLPVIEFLPSAFLIGLLLAWTYVIKLSKGKKYAYGIVALIHALHNLLALLVFLAIR